MKKQRKHSQLKDQEDSPEETNNDIDLFSLKDTKFKKEVMKIWKELRKAFNRNADYGKKELETVRRSQEKENSFVEIKAQLKAMTSRMKNKEERISDQEDRINENYAIKTEHQFFLKMKAI